MRFSVKNGGGGGIAHTSCTLPTAQHKKKPKPELDLIQDTPMGSCEEQTTEEQRLVLVGGV